MKFQKTSENDGNFGDITNFPKLFRLVRTKLLIIFLDIEKTLNHDSA